MSGLQPARGRELSSSSQSGYWLPPSRYVTCWTMSRATAGQCRCFGSTHPEYTRDVATLRAVLGETAFDAAWAAGRRLPIEQAIVQCLDDEGAV